MKTIIAGLALAFCASVPLNAQEKPQPPPPHPSSDSKLLDAEYHGPNAHCRTVRIHRHHHAVTRVRKCKD